ncbi:MAG: transglutaminase family protein [Promethearchaeota archaeon]
MTVNLPIQMAIAAPSKSHGLPAANPGEKVTVTLSRTFHGSGRQYDSGALYVTDPFGVLITKIPFSFGEYTRGQFKFHLGKHNLTGVYQVIVSFKETKIKGLPVDKSPFEGVPDDREIFGSFFLKGAYPSIVTQRVTYQATITNKAVNSIRNIQMFIAVPPSLPSRQEILDLKIKPTSGHQANDLSGNNWVHFTHNELPPKSHLTFGYSALIRSRSIRYELPTATRKIQVPSGLKAYTKPEQFIDSHHHLIKDLAKDIARTNPRPIQFIKAAMRKVHKILKYERQEEERGAAYAIEKRKGDCTEFAALFTALCRAYGLPARLQAGFGFGGKSFERHAWSEVWIRGLWVPVDPTWHGSSGLLGITSRHVPIIIGNWMSNRIRQELSYSWRAVKGTTSPDLSVQWKVQQVAKVSTDSGRPKDVAPVQLQASVPDAIPSGKNLPMKVTVTPIPKGRVPLEYMLLTATVSDGEMDNVVAIEPLPANLQAPLNLRLNVPMPSVVPKTTLSLRLWVDRKPTSTVWRKTIGLL